MSSSTFPAFPASPALTEGRLTGAGLIMAIGAQNALVLRQGLLRNHVALVVGVCAVSGVPLIDLGVFGLGAAIASSPLLMAAFRFGAVAVAAPLNRPGVWRVFDGLIAVLMAVLGYKLLIG